MDPSGRLPRRSHQLALALELAPAYDAENFLVAPSNQQAFALLDQWPHWPTRTLVLVGAPGSGKSHLATIWARHADATIVPSSTIDPQALAHRTAVVEDCDRCRPNEADLFHLMNLAHERGGWLLLTARTGPDNWGLKTADLLSRLRMAATRHIAQADDQMIRAVLVKLFADRQIRVAEDVIAYATRHLDQSLEAAANFVRVADTVALAAGRRVTRPLVAAIIQSLQSPDDQGPM